MDNDAAGETVAPAFGIEAKNVIAIFRCFADPQFADHTAFGKDFLHLGLLTLLSMRPSSRLPPQKASERRVISAPSNHQIMSCGAKL